MNFLILSCRKKKKRVNKILKIENLNAFHRVTTSRTITKKIILLNLTYWIDLETTLLDFLIIS